MMPLKAETTIFYKGQFPQTPKCGRCSHIFVVGPLLQPYCGSEDLRPRQQRSLFNPCSVTGGADSEPYLTRTVITSRETSSVRGVVRLQSQRSLRRAPSRWVNQALASIANSTLEMRGKPFKRPFSKALAQPTRSRWASANSTWGQERDPPTTWRNHAEPPAMQARTCHQTLSH